MADEVLEFALSEHYHPGRGGYIHPRSWEHGVMPLTEFNADHAWAILVQVDRRTPPAKWITAPLFQMPSRAHSEWHWARGLKLRKDPGHQPRGRRHIADSLRFAVYERDGFACLHCGTNTSLSLDHIYPHSLGGEDTFDNLQTLCRPCNSRKGVKV